ncbi:MAG: thioredoxin family protein [Gaiellaceae bacterium]
MRRAPPTRRLDSRWRRRVTQDTRPLLVFFTSHTSGPARRMESLLAHVARKERDTLRVRRVDVDERPDLAERFKIEEIPSLALVKGKRVVARLAGRSTAPKIEDLLDAHVRDNVAA